MNTGPQNRCGSLWARTRRQDNETRALDARKASCAAPISMGRGEIPVELRPEEVPSAASSHPFSASFVLIFLAKGGHSMQEKSAAGKTGTLQKTLEEKATYRFGNRSFVVEPVFRQDGPDTLGSILLRLMKSESEAK